MKKKLIGIFVCMLLMATILPVSGEVTNGSAENSQPDAITTETINYNLIQQINPTRTFLPRVYLSGSFTKVDTIATFDAYIINEGPEDSSSYTLELKWTRIYGKYSEVILETEIGEYEPIPAGIRRHVYLNFECWVDNNIFFNLGINVYEIQITNTADDLNLNDNIATFRYIALGF